MLRLDIFVQTTATPFPELGKTRLDKFDYTKQINKDYLGDNREVSHTKSSRLKFFYFSLTPLKPLSCSCKEKTKTIHDTMTIISLKPFQVYSKCSVKRLH